MGKRVGQFEFETGLPWYDRLRFGKGRSSVKTVNTYLHFAFVATPSFIHRVNNSSKSPSTSSKVAGFANFLSKLLLQPGDLISFDIVSAA
jgi:hypothetical protein